MRILTYCDVNGSDILERLGTPEYSYHFVLEAFQVALSQFAQVQRIDKPTEADAIWRQCSDASETCLLLSFAPPHKTTLGLQCPTIPVFAWEYPNLPSGNDEESWLTDARNDWPQVLLKCGAAITLSTHTVRAVQDSLGNTYPIEAIPTPLWEKFSSYRMRGTLPPDRASVDICLKTRLVDSDLLGLSAENLVTSHPDDGTPSDPEADMLLPPLPPVDDNNWLVELDSLQQDTFTESAGISEGMPPIDTGWDIPPLFNVSTRLSGVVYTAVLTPSDGRKNWEDVITAFGWAFRDVPDATLVLKLGGPDQLKHHHQMLMLMSKLSPMKCRIIALHGYLDDADYGQLIGASTYYVNASLCEGLCMPLMEFLCCVPAIAPNHTSMVDYLQPEFAFMVDSTPNLPTVWPHGDHQVYKTSRHQINWHSLMLAYQQSYIVAKSDPPAYAAMSASAMADMEDYCAIDGIALRLQQFLESRLRDLNAKEAHMAPMALTS